ncbi:MAG: DUF5693 family protein [Candidatus Bipolaricaulota bacterium]|nr:DUF5693 family protein [Candidatus Bipolaricaulota bacterium]
MSLRRVALLFVLLSLGVAIWVDIGRIRWEGENQGFVTVIHAENAGAFSLSQLAGAGLDMIAVRASFLAHGNQSYLDQIQNAGLEPALIVDGAVPVSLPSVRFPLVWSEWDSLANERLLIGLLQQGGSLVLREFTDPAQERRLWEAGMHRMVRGHEIPKGDLRWMSRSAILARWERAVFERGIRCLILAPLPGAEPQESLGYFQAVNAQLIEAGYHPGALSTPPAPGHWTEIIFHLGVSSLLLLVLLRILKKLPFACLLVAGATAVLAIGTNGIMLRQIDALLIAILAPSYIFLLLVPWIKSGLRAGLRFFLCFCMGSILAGLFLSAILTHPIFMLKLAQFRGVKLSLILPPIIGMILYYRRIGWWRFKRLVAFPRPVVGWGLLGLSGIALVYLTLRSGNIGGLTLEMEGSIRRWLEEILVARPRFKEFLIGHPLLLLFGADQRLGSWRAFPLLFGLIGQASIINSFAHAHTPLLLSLWRTGNGILLGLGIGVGLVILVQFGRLLWQKVGLF